MKKIDVFIIFNTLLFLFLCIFRYYARFIEYRGSAHVEEFFIYAIFILIGIVALWWVFRNYEFNSLLLLLVQCGILMHFSGAFIQIEGGRLYDAYIFDIRYDKYVHFINAFSISILISRLFHIQHIALTRVNRIFVVLVVMGLGALVEIVEYLVVLTVPHHGVGGYDNNMQDLIANFLGSCSFAFFHSFAHKHRSNKATPYIIITPTTIQSD